MLNEEYFHLRSSYLFSTIAERVREFQKQHPSEQVISLGIGDVTRPLSPVVIEALHKAVDEMAEESSFRGYGPEQGYTFLREAIATTEYRKKNIHIHANDIFVSDGSKCDVGNFQELFSNNAKVAIPDPVYPVYIDTNVMAGRSGPWKEDRYENFVYLAATAANNFFPHPPAEHVDFIYLCSPNNPTGAVATREKLQQFVDYARKEKAIILFDAAYEGFIRNPTLPHSIFEIPGAMECAVEFRSLSKTAGFTGLRAAYTVIPSSCTVTVKDTVYRLQDLWARRQSTKFNGLSYPVQRAAEAVFGYKGQAQVRELTDYYLKNATIIRAILEETGFSFAGGDNSPYIWADTDTDSWQFFDFLLEKAQVVATPGIGFGPSGKGKIRFSAFALREKILEAIKRLRPVLIEWKKTH